MLRHTLTTSMLRFYENENPSEYEDYCAICSLIWESKDVVWLVGFKGNVTRKHLRQLLKFLFDNNIKIVKAHRSPKHILPFGEEVNGYLQIEVDNLVKRFMKKD